MVNSFIQVKYTREFPLDMHPKFMDDALQVVWQLENLSFPKCPHQFQMIKFQSNGPWSKHSSVWRMVFGVFKARFNSDECNDGFTLNDSYELQ